MKLNKLIEPLFIKNVVNPSEIEITNVQYDSRKVTPGTLFICLKGYTVDGHDFVQEAMNKGAVAFLVEQDIHAPKSISVIKVPDTRRAMALIADTFYESPSSRLQTIGITGTNGKTTTSAIIQEILNDNACESGLIGTINIKYGDVVVDSKNTTPDSLELQQIFHDMIKANMSHVVMEVSSHALSLGRTRGTNFKTAIFTNFTQDHLDYHKTMDEYAQAKGLLFSQLGNSYCNNSSFAVLNADDAMSTKYSEITPAQVITYGIKNTADVYATDINITPKGTSFTLNTFVGNTVIETKLIGEFNVYNILAAVSACLIEGISLEAIRISIQKIAGVPGRFETVFENQDFPVIVDYAHTPDSLENVLQTVRKFSTGNVRCVVGCGGDRDATKRPIMAAIAEKYSDMVFLTSDNPRSENPESILLDMEKGLTGEHGGSYFKVLSREEAIKRAVTDGPSPLTENDCVVIVGKGHETYQIIGEQTAHFDDREVARKYLQQV